MSLQKDALRWEEIEKINLIEERIRFKYGSEESLSLEKIWAGFLFLKAMGFESIEFHESDIAHVQSWLQRIESYQQSFIEDPESILVEECAWNELHESKSSPIIECHQRIIKIDSKPSELYVVPPMDAPLSVEPNALRAFLYEIDHQKDEDILLRLQSILQEFRLDSKNIDSKLWTSLVGDIIAVALESRLLDKAVVFAEEHREALVQLWEDSDRSLRLFAAYEPTKTSDVQKWSRIFEGLPIEKLVQYLTQSLSSSAGPQIVRLLSYRANLRPDELANFCFKSDRPIQKQLLQWLSPYWKPEHYHRIYDALLSELENGSDGELVQSWIQALLRSYKSQAFSDLKDFFKKESWRKKLFSKTKAIDESKQRSVVLALAEFPSAESFSFLKEIRNQVKGKTADEVERLIQSYKLKGFQK